MTKIGTITVSYDPPASRWLPSLPYPHGFAHDLSLITDNDLPRVASFPGTPKVIGWGKYSDVLSGNPIFITGMNLFTGRVRQYIGRGVSPAAQIAVAEGVAYHWDREACVQTASLLWRIERDGDRVMGLSGAVLCLGVPTDRVCKVVAFKTLKLPSRRPCSNVTTMNRLPAMLPVRQSKADFYSLTKYEKRVLFATKRSTLSIRIRFPRGGVLVKEGYLPSRSGRSRSVKLISKDKCT